jgi:hypothetical protein
LQPGIGHRGAGIFRKGWAGLLHQTAEKGKIGAGMLEYFKALPCVSCLNGRVGGRCLEHRGDGGFM